MFQNKTKTKNKTPKNLCVEKEREGGKMNDKTNKCDKMLTFGASGKRIYSNSLYPIFVKVL